MTTLACRKKATDYTDPTDLHIEALGENPNRDLICSEAITIAGCRKSLLLPFYSSAKKLPSHRELIEKWSKIAFGLALRDAEVCETFLLQTPKCLSRLDMDGILQWGSTALQALSRERHLGKAAKAYLKASLADEPPVPLCRWKFFLEQAATIARFSPKASESFILFGVRICQNLTDQEVKEWIKAGFAAGSSMDHLIGYFSGTTAFAFEKRNEIKSHVALKDKIHLLSLICEANLGKPVRIQSSASLAEVDGFSGKAATDGCVIYLPEVASSFTLLKLMALHQSVLMDDAVFDEGFEDPDLDTVQLHLDTDRRMLERLPGLGKDMKRLNAGDLPDAHPPNPCDCTRKTRPWWGDILFTLARQSERTIQDIQVKAADHIHCRPEDLEGLLAGMIARGERSAENLWEKLRLMFNTTGFGSPEPENVPENVKTYFYPEWDKDIFAYKKNWCLVRQLPASDAPNSFVSDAQKRLHGLVSLVRYQFMKFKPQQFKRFKSQAFGDDLDIDALIQTLCDKRAGSSLSENVYIRRDKTQRDVAVLFLLDVSESTDGKINGRRVIDIQKEAVVLMAEALESIGDAYALYGFNSEGRSRVNLFTVKDFREPRNEQVKHRIGNLAPEGLTRLGTAIRHAASKIDAVRARVKLMVILTDGRPYDYDYGDMEYAIADTKKAIQETGKLKIHPFIITSDQQGVEYMKRIAPATQSIVLPDIERLPSMLPAVYKRLTV